MPDAAPRTTLEDITPAACDEIQRRIDAIAREEGIEVLFAIESGSRAWGFPSSDSDYDVRFVYVHPRDWYLSLQPGRDVIERPIVDDFDVSGWDLRKALNLMLKSNPVLLEWLTSPIRYRWTERAERLRTLAQQATYQTPCAHHYWKLARRQWEPDAGEIKIKRYLYTLRAALALHWLDQKEGQPPPMNVFDLLDGVSLSAGANDALLKLIARKAQGRERGVIAKDPALDAVIDGAFAWAEANANAAVVRANLRDEAQAFFRVTVNGKD